MNTIHVPVLVVSMDDEHIYAVREIDLDTITYEQWKQIKNDNWFRSYAMGFEDDEEWQRFLWARPQRPEAKEIELENVVITDFGREALAKALGTDASPRWSQLDK